MDFFYCELSNRWFIECEHNPLRCVKRWRYTRTWVRCSSVDIFPWSSACLRTWPSFHRTFSKWTESCESSRQQRAPVGSRHSNSLMSIVEQRGQLLVTCKTKWTFNCLQQTIGEKFGLQTGRKKEEKTHWRLKLFSQFEVKSDFSDKRSTAWDFVVVVGGGGGGLSVTIITTTSSWLIVTEVRESSQLSREFREEWNSDEVRKMAGLFTVSDGFTSSVHPTLFPHQVSELSETEQRERLKNAFFDCLRKMNSDPVTLTGRLFFTSFVDFSFRELDSTSLCVFLPHPLCIKKKFNARSLCIFAMCVLCACVCMRYCPLDFFFSFSFTNV